jgi:hypothetical protein
MRVRVWRAEVAYYQGRYSAASEMTEALMGPLEEAREFAYAALALRIRIFILLARADYAGIEALG